MIKNFIIDGQVLQTQAWHRGMGKYLIQVLRELSLMSTEDLSYVLIFNDSIETENERFETLKYICPNIVQKHYSLPLPNENKISSNDYTELLSKHINEDFGEDNNAYMLSSLFQFNFFAEFPSVDQKLVLFYDLTPLLFWKDLGGYFPPELYMERFQQLIQADHIFAISETTKTDLLTTLGLPSEKITNINGGFTKISESSTKPKDFSVPSKYILFPTGDLPHKNNEVAVKGFEEFHAKNDSDVPLLITSKFSDSSKAKLSMLSKNIVFTNNVSDKELEWLFENAEAVLFASKYEGLGMPVLDAVANQKPIIVSNIPVFEEMSERAFYYFKVDDSTDLSLSIDKALRHEDFSEKLKHYPDILEKYTWANTSNLIGDHINALTQLVNKDSEASPKTKPRLAVVCLHPGIINQIGRLSEPLFFSLSQFFTVDYYFDANGYNYREMERPTFLDFFSCKIYDIGKLTIPSYRKYDKVLYLVDDKCLPSRMAQRASVLPGYAIANFEGKLDQQEGFLKKAVIDNQYEIFKLKSAEYSEYIKFAKMLLNRADDLNSAPGRAEAIINRRESNSSIISKLIGLTSKQ